MGLFKNKKNDPNSKKFRWEMARTVEGQHIKYVTEKKDGEVDEVIGCEVITTVLEGGETSNHKSMFFPEKCLKIFY